jgi:flagellar hook assembly protein FlgD
VFSPNGDGCNDLFSAYGATQIVEKCEAVELQRCARFVGNVKLKVLNRWGRQVYTFNSADGNTIYVNWDGRDDNGNLLDPGVYYYVADVIFDVRDPELKSKRMKGWVQLIR